MNPTDAICLVTLEATRLADGSLLIAGHRHPCFPDEISVEGRSFDLSDEEEINAADGF